MKYLHKLNISQFQLVEGLVLGGMGIVLFQVPALSQITPDSTLGAESSVVKNADVKGLPAELIEGGAARGSNLFHSFQDFNVDDLQRVYFANPAGIDNILSRVTGGNISNILGTLGVDGVANLFLLNPNGIIFGTDAVLDIRGSFNASSADGIKLGEDGFFSASDPSASNLLGVAPGALFYNAIREFPGALQNSAVLEVESGQSLTLSGDKITNKGTLKASGGSIEIIARDQVILEENSIIDTSKFTPHKKRINNGPFRPPSYVPDYSRPVIGGNVTIKVEGTDNTNSVNPAIKINQATIKTSAWSKAGEIIIQSEKNDISIKDSNSITAESPRGPVPTVSGTGDITFNAKNGNLTLNNTKLKTSAFGDSIRSSGAISLQAGKEITVINNSNLDSTSGTGFAGRISAEANTVSFQNSTISSRNASFGEGGGIFLNAKIENLTLSDSYISTNAIPGEPGAGTINLQASNKIALKRTSVGSNTFANTPGEINAEANIISISESTIEASAQQGNYARGGTSPLTLKLVI